MFFAPNMNCAFGARNHSQVFGFSDLEGSGGTPPVLG
jgi:hypothetical protein